jgi:hypothetical protein
MAAMAAETATAIEMVMMTATTLVLTPSAVPSNAQQGGPKDLPSKVRKVFLSGESKWRVDQLGCE